MSAVELTPEVLNVIKAFNRNVEWLKAQSIKPKPEQWISYAEARAILPRSKQWFQYYRMGYTDRHSLYHAPALIEGKDWRRVGAVIEYRCESIVSLKAGLVKVPGSAGMQP